MVNQEVHELVCGDVAANGGIFMAVRA